MPKTDKKQRHRIRREKKRREARRREGISPFKRLADAPGEIEYWMSDGFDSFHQTQIQVYKRAAGLSGLACFLIDKGVVGLKDAYTRLNIEYTEFRDSLDAGSARGITMRRATLAEVRQMVAGGIRWAHDNGMRLPKEWPKAALLIGGVGDWMTADVSKFRKDFVGHPEDLRQRLIGEPFDSYLRRTDIQFIFSEDAPYMDQRTGEYVKQDITRFEDDDDVEEEDFEDDDPDDAGILEGIDSIGDRLFPIAEALSAETRSWLNSRGETPSPFLNQAWLGTLLASALTHAEKPDATEAEAEASMKQSINQILQKVVESRRPEFRRALDQAAEHVASDPGLMNRIAGNSNSED